MTYASVIRGLPHKAAAGGGGEGTLIGVWEWGGSGNLNTIAAGAGVAGTNGSTAFGVNDEDVDANGYIMGDFPAGTYSYGGYEFTSTADPTYQNSQYARWNDGANAEVTDFVTNIVANLTVGVDYELRAL